MAECLNPTYFGSCRKCKTCLERRQRSWVLRMLLEAMLYEPDETTFVTLTYAPQYLPDSEDAAKVSLQRFFKRLRKEYKDKPVRYVASLEKGSQNTHRFHWHVILYGIKFNYINKEWIRTRWKNGFIDFKPATGGRMSYVIKYVIKGGKFLMSRRPGIGSGMIDELEKLILKLSRNEIVKLRGNIQSLNYPAVQEGLSRIRIGKYDFPLHRFLKERLLKPPVKVSDHVRYSILEEIRYGKKDTKEVKSK